MFVELHTCFSLSSSINVGSTVLSMGLPNKYSSLLTVPGPLYNQSTLSSRALNIHKISSHYYFIHR